MTHIIYKGKLTNELLKLNSKTSKITDTLCIYYSGNYLKIMCYSTYKMIWGRDNMTVVPIDLPKKILYRFITLYELLNDFDESFDAITAYFIEYNNENNSNNK